MGEQARLTQPPLQRRLLFSWGNMGVRRNADYSRAPPPRKTGSRSRPDWVSLIAPYFVSQATLRHGRRADASAPAVFDEGVGKLKLEYRTVSRRKFLLRAFPP